MHVRAPPPTHTCIKDAATASCSLNAFPPPSTPSSEPSAGPWSCRAELLLQQRAQRPSSLARLRRSCSSVPTASSLFHCLFFFLNVILFKFSVHVCQNPSESEQANPVQPVTHWSLLTSQLTPTHLLFSFMSAFEIRLRLYTTTTTTVKKKKICKSNKLKC